MQEKHSWIHIHTYTYIYIYMMILCKLLLWGGNAFRHLKNTGYFLPKSPVFVGLFCKRDLYFQGAYKALPPQTPCQISNIGLFCGNIGLFFAGT